MLLYILRVQLYTKKALKNWNLRSIGLILFYLKMASIVSLQKY